MVASVCLMAPAQQRGLVLSCLWVAPWLEELFFRACLQESLLRRWADVGTAHARRQGMVNLGVALLFGCAHAVARDLWTGVAVVVPALGFGLLYQKSRRVAPVAVLHGLCNVPWLLLQLRPLI
jgi:membrane protease YdiL (CAAX protease family)